MHLKHYKHELDRVSVTQSNLKTFPQPQGAPLSLVIFCLLSHASSPLHMSVRIWILDLVLRHALYPLIEGGKKLYSTNAIGFQPPISRNRIFYLFKDLILIRLEIVDAIETTLLAVSGWRNAFRLT